MVWQDTPTAIEAMPDGRISGLQIGATFFCMMRDANGRSFGLNEVPGGSAHATMQTALGGDADDQVQIQATSTVGNLTMGTWYNNAM